MDFAWCELILSMQQKSNAVGCHGKLQHTIWKTLIKSNDWEKIIIVNRVEIWRSASINARNNRLLYILWYFFLPSAYLDVFGDFSQLLFVFTTIIWGSTFQDRGIQLCLGNYWSYNTCNTMATWRDFTPTIKYHHICISLHMMSSNKYTNFHSSKHMINLKSNIAK
jgi:hypothetical protein